MAKTIRIGHASISETGTINGTPGDSTGKEVYIDTNNDITKKGYHVLLRPKTNELAEKSAKACEAACNNNKIGYSQFGSHGRLTLYNEAKNVNFDLASITTACNTDCSAFMAVCAIAAGASTISASVTTSTMVSAFVNSGHYTKFIDNKYFSSSDYLQRGDILVKEGSHTIMILDNGIEVPSISYHEGPQWPTDYFAIKIAVNLLNIDATKISANATITKIENKEEKALSDVAEIALYDWKYKLSSIADSTIRPKSEKLEVKTSDTVFSVSNLISGYSYMLNVTAKEKTGTVVFTSPNIIFTTAKEYKANHSLDVTFKPINNSIKICKTFIKIKDKFKRALLYNRRKDL